MARVQVIGVRCEMKDALIAAGLERDIEDPSLIFNLSMCRDRLKQRIPKDQLHKVLNANLVLDKLEQNRRFHSAGVSTPATVEATTGLTPGDKTGGWLVKPRRSSQGRGIRMLKKNEDSIGDTAYLQQRIDKVREFRAHVALWFDPPCFTIQEKKPREPGEEDYKEGAREALCWNLASGWKYKRPTNPTNHKQKCRETGLYRRVDGIARAAVEALGYDFGAVDIIMDADRNLYVLEVNSHPGVQSRRSCKSVEIYKQVFGALLK